MAYIAKDTLVIVDWLDAWSDGETWHEENAKELNGDVQVRSVGYVAKHEKKGITLYTSRTSEGHYGGFHFVPKGMIKSITTMQ